MRSDKRPRPPTRERALNPPSSSLPGKGENSSPPRGGEGPGERASHGGGDGGQGIGLNPDEITIAEILKGQSYATKIVGKWHCGDQPEFLPTRHGFDSYYGLPYSNDMGIQASHLFRPMPPLPLLRDEEVIEEQPDQASLTSRYVEESVRFMMYDLPDRG